MRRKKALKLRHKIVKETLNHKGPYLTNRRAIDLWFRYINRAVFNNELPNFDKIIIKKWLKQAVGQVCAYPDKDPKRFELEMLRKYNTKKDFIETLAHEMIHLYQFALKKDTGNHNSIFYSFRPRFKFIGLGLSL
jgi:hypothetical protein